MKKLLSFFLALFMCVGMFFVPNTVKASSLDTEEIFKTWINFPGESLGAGYAAGWSYVSGSDELRTTENVGFTGYYNPGIRNFTTGKFTCDILNQDGDPLGFVWGLKKGSKNGQDTYSFYEYEECGHNMWSISYVSEWIPAKDAASHRGPVYHGTISAADSQYHHNGGSGSVGFATGTVLAYGSLPSDGLKGTRHTVSIEIEKTKVKVLINGKLLKEVSATVQGGSFGPCTASNPNAHFYGLTMEAAVDNAAISAGFNYKLDGKIVNVAKLGDDIQVEDTSKVESPATIINREWIVTRDGVEIYRGSTPYTDYGKQAGKYETVLNIESSQGITSTKKDILYVIDANADFEFQLNGEEVNIIQKGDDIKLVDNSKIEAPATGTIEWVVELDGEEIYRGDKPYEDYNSKPGRYETSVTVTTDQGLTLTHDEILYVTDESNAVIAVYVDEEGKKISDDLIYRGNVGSKYSTVQLEIPGYEFVKVEGNKSGKFTVKPQLVKYIYTYIGDSGSGGQDPGDGGVLETGKVTVKYVDEEGNALHEDIIYKGSVGSDYNSIEITIPGYDFVRVDGDRNGEYTKQDKEVTYVYKKNSSYGHGESDNAEIGNVTVKYVDESGKTIHEDIVYEGYVGSDYEAPKLVIPGYDYVKVDGNVTGEFIDGNIDVIYTYKPIEGYNPDDNKTGGSIVIKYKDKEGNVIDEDIIDGNVGDNYEIPTPDIPGYSFDKITNGEPSGVFDDKVHEVDVIYDKDGGSIIIRYEDEDGNFIKEEVIDGNVGDDYEVPTPDIPGYNFDKIVGGDKEGTLDDDVHDVTVVYKKQGGSVVVRYQDENGYALKSDQVYNGGIGDKFNIKHPNIPGYVFVRVEGSEVGEFNESIQVVTYIYKKAPASNISSESSNNINKGGKNAAYGGVSTSDSSNLSFYIIVSMISLCCVSLGISKLQEKK